MKGLSRAAIVSPIAVAILIAGCGATATPSPQSTPESTPVDTGPISYETGPTDLVIQASSGGGLLPESMRRAEMPNVSIYGDGRVVKLGRHGSGPEDPLLPELVETRVSADGMARILAAAREAGALGEDRRYDLPNTYDLWTVRFTVTANGKTHRVSAFGLGFDEESRLAPPGEMEARKHLDEFYGRLVDLRAWLPAGIVGADSAYEPAQTRVFMTRLVDWSGVGGGSTPAPASPRVDQEVRDWPFPQPPELFGTAADARRDWYCAVLDETAPLGLESATWDTRWRSKADLYQIVAQPILPGEPGCPATI